MIMKFCKKSLKSSFFGIFLFASSFLCASPSQVAKKCKKAFQKERASQSEEISNFEDLPLFQSANLHSTSPSVFSNDSLYNLQNPQELESKKPILSILPGESHQNIKPSSRLTQKRKEEATAEFLEAFERKDFKKIKSLIIQFPFLKAVRFKNPSFINRSVEKTDRIWCPEGWGPLQLATYTKDLQTLDWLLKLDFNVRTKKKTGGVSLESNPLHIAIKRNFPIGAKKILEHENYVPFGKNKNRFIDEKNHNKQTAWALAVQKDIERRRLRYTLLIGRYHPSGYVESYSVNGPKDGYEIARDTGEQVIIDLARKYLVAPNYEEHKKNKRAYGHRTKPP